MKGKAETKKLTAEELVAAIKQYFELADKIHQYFGYKEDWVTIPMSDNTSYYWMLVGGDETGAGGRLVYADKPFTKKLIEKGNIYSGPVYTQRFLPRWVYRTETHTLISYDTHTDGNKFLSIMDNTKECKDEELKKEYQNRWE